MNYYNTAALRGGFATYSDTTADYYNLDTLREMGQEVIERIFPTLPIASQASIDYAYEKHKEDDVNAAAGYVYALDSARQHIFYSPTWEDQDAWKAVVRKLKRDLKEDPRFTKIKKLVPKFKKYFHKTPAITEAEWKYLEDQNAAYVPSGAYRFLPNPVNAKPLSAARQKVFDDSKDEWKRFLTAWKKKHNIVAKTKKKGAAAKRWQQPNRGKRPKRLQRVVDSDDDDEEMSDATEQ